MMKATGYIFISFFLLTACSDSSKKSVNQKPILQETGVKPNFEVATDPESVEKQKLLKQYFTSLVKQRKFNGTVLIAKKGKIIYKDAFGYTNFKTKDTLT